jgi:hypothetical protein
MSPQTLSPVVGLKVTLRLIQPEDVDCVRALCASPSYNHHLSELRAANEDQRRWMKCYERCDAVDLRL